MTEYTSKSQKTDKKTTAVQNPTEALNLTAHGLFRAVAAAADCCPSILFCLYTSFPARYGGTKMFKG
jgi:hypothetical protein